MFCGLSCKSNKCRKRYFRPCGGRFPRVFSVSNMSYPLVLGWESDLKFQSFPGYRVIFHFKRVAVCFRRTPAWRQRETLSRALNGFKLRADCRVSVVDLTVVEKATYEKILQNHLCLSASFSLAFSFPLSSFKSPLSPL